MPVDLPELQAAINAWPVLTVPDEQTPNAARRLLDAIAGLSSGAAGGGDIAALTRQILLEDAARFGGQPQLRFPSTPPWPQPATWEAAGCTAMAAAGRVSVTAVEWHPPVGPGEDVAAAAAQVREVYRGTQSVACRALDDVPADPFWRQTVGYPTYRSAAQRAAARAVALAPEGSTVVVALPTGRGKTDVAWSRALSRATGVTIVVVPTVVLALDMERRTRAYSATLPQPLSPVDRYAYVGSLSDDAKRAVRDAVRDGTQRIVYTSPEALMSGLREAVVACASAGLLRQFVVDEAHIVDQWGQDFRPEFLTMAALQNELLVKAPLGERPVTLLLSATLTGRHIDLLQRTFRSPNGCHVVWGSSLRTEPAYFTTGYDTGAEREAAVVEAARKLPRPLVLYVSKVADAKYWQQVLGDAGMLRVAAVTGQSADEHRRTVVQRWRGSSTDGARVATEYDVVVGTSAFGLGIDVENVRSVVHACLPETVDRFYQEVGRSGRDGLPTVSVLATGPGDDRVAQSLNRVVLIGADKGWARWTALRDSGRRLGDGRLRIDLSALPGYLTEGYGRSEQWNVRVLTLMAQSDLIELSAPTVPVREPEEDDASFDGRVEKFYEQSRTVLDIRVRKAAALAPDGWVRTLAETRDTVAAAQDAALRAMHDIARGAGCVGARLAQHYRARLDTGSVGTEAACRGCPNCRRTAAEYGVFPVEPQPELPRFTTADDPLGAGGPLLFVWWAAPAEYDDLLPALLAHLAMAGAAVFHCSDAALLDEAQRRAPERPVLHDDGELLTGYEGLVTVILERGATTVPDDVRTRYENGLPTYVLGPGTLRAPGKPQWVWRDVADAVVSVAGWRNLSWHC